MKRMIQIAAVSLALAVIAVPGMAVKRLTLLHTNDLHSHLLGAAPNLAYSPATLNDDTTRGGFARIASVIRDVRQNSPHPVLVVDAGDFMMGSLFHLLSREHAYELRLLSMMGYDALTLGNHEFDLKPAGLARILNSAERYGRLPAVVAANLVFSPGAEDDALEELYSAGRINPYRVLERGGLRIGIFGLMGKDAAEVAPFADPVTFSDPLESARKWVRKLREDEKVDLVICLSHGGLNPDPDRSEDEILAREVDGIDVIVSGHTHSRLKRPLTVNDTIIVQAWEYGKEIGILELALQAGDVKLAAYTSRPIDDTIVGDADITRDITAFQSELRQGVLNEMGLGFDQVIATTDFDLTITTGESNLGNLITDAIRWDVNRHLGASTAASPGVAVGVISNGVIRDPIVRGINGKVAVCDVFRAIPLGIGFDAEQTMGYPLIALYLYPAELKKAMEILTSIYPLKGSDYYLQVSGLRVTHNPKRMLFDRVTGIWLGDGHRGYTRLDCSSGNKELIGVTADIYNATFLKVIGDFTWGILHIEPKSSDGSPIQDLRTARVDANPNQPGIQELKEWQSVMAYIRQMPDTDRDGIANIPAGYRGPRGRQVAAASMNPVHLVSGGNWVTWTVVAVFVFVIAFLAATVVWAWRRWSH